MSKTSVLNITDTLTPAFFVAHLDVSEHSVRYARTAGIFPASWFAVVRAECDRLKVDCPLSAFNWKGAAGDGKDSDLPPSGFVPAA